jgi:hypothetical protein
LQIITIIPYVNYVVINFLLHTVILTKCLTLFSTTNSRWVTDYHPYISSKLVWTYLRFWRKFVNSMRILNCSVEIHLRGVDNKTFT